MLLLGFGLVNIPRSMLREADPASRLRHAYHKCARHPPFPSLSASVHARIHLSMITLFSPLPGSSNPCMRSAACRASDSVRGISVSLFCA